MATYPHIERYRAEKQQLIEFGGSDSELNIRPAFQNCLAAYCADHRERLALVPERPAPGGVPDGTVLDSLRMARGYWEAKDSRDNLDREIQNKFNRGYPRDNIIFEDSETAVLFQNGGEAMRVDMSRPGELHRLIERFLDYELPQIEEFRKAREQFKRDLPNVLAGLRETIEEAAKKPDYRAAAAAFLDLCRKSIGPAVTNEDVREMLLQHTLTKDIFLRVFVEDSFHKENNVAKELGALEETAFTADMRRETTARLRPYYAAIGRAADEIADFTEKQQFLKALYQDFYQVYNPAAADRLGVVYTPDQIVDFIIRGADYLLHKHFGRTLADDKVQILDPATGTGTFVTNLMNYLPAERLEYKYRNEIHANELAILPYYIANLNIEYTYKERTGRYLEFPNLCFVDTLDNMEWSQAGATGGAVQRQSAFNLGGISVDNWMRIQLQNEKPISVIIGNPPYNANQRNENENNKNREYPEIDERIKETYIASSTAQKTKQYDMYKRFIRWASDRLDDEGILAFITNRSYIESRQDDGFRKIVMDEFTDLYVVDLGGDLRKNRGVGNVFGIMTGVAVGFFVRNGGVDSKAKKIHFYALPDEWSGANKLARLPQLSLGSIPFDEILPDHKGNWLNQSNTGFDNLLSLANKETKFSQWAAGERAIFKRYSMGVVTNRDDWTYDFDSAELSKKVRALIEGYENSRSVYGGKEFDDADLPANIKWTRDLKRQLRIDKPNVFQPKMIRQTLFRPFVSKSLYFDQSLNEMQYQLPELFPKGFIGENKAICFSANGEPFYVLATNRVVDLHFTGDTQCLPLYRYRANGERARNITTWGIKQVNDHYKEEYGEQFKVLYPGRGISAEDIFAYAYAVLHDPDYREEYAIDLKQEFPRLPLYRDFKAWAAMGQELFDLHIGFESAAPFPLERVDTGKQAKRVLLRADTAGGRIVLDDVTTLRGVPERAWRYRLGSRSALEWVLDQHKERTPRDPTIRERFNTYRFADHKERVIDLLRRVCAVSVRTMEIVDAMGAGKAGRERVEWTAPGR